jgi:hypothetical protein
VILNEDITEVILEVASRRFTRPGDSFKMRHTAIVEGGVCTPESKDPAMTITRSAFGWVWYCHRCTKGGFIKDGEQSPSETKKAVGRVKSNIAEVIENNVTYLPHDFRAMKDYEADSKFVPFAAYDWLWKAQIVEEQIVDCNIGWSEVYNRVIIPIYNTENWELIGWVGREVMCRTKEERVGRGYPKYITRKNKGEDRCYFTARGANLDEIVIVEDCLSAIRVAHATGKTCIALLSTSIDDKLIKWLRGKWVYIWLDNDAKAKGLKMSIRCQSLGVAARYLNTPKDPKAYNDLALYQFIENNEKEIYTNEYKVKATNNRKV